MEESSQTSALQIETTNHEIVRGFPLAAGLTSVSDVINQLPYPTPYPPSFFPPSSHPFHLPHQDQTLIQHQREIDLLLLPSTKEEEEEEKEWKDSVMALVRTEVEEEVRKFRGGGEGEAWGGTIFPPPFLPSFTRRAPPPPLSSTSTRVLEAISFPDPPPSLSVPSGRPPATASSAKEFFRSFLEGKKEERLRGLELSQKASSTNHNPASNGHQQVPSSSSSSSNHQPFLSSSAPPPPPQQPPSSPDPLAISSSSSTSRVQTSVPFSPTHPSPKRPTQTFSLQIPSPSKEQIRSIHSSGGGKRVTDSERSSSGGGGGGKRRKLDDSASLGGSGGGVGAGAWPGAGKDFVDGLTDYISDLFSADDSLVDDTSTSHQFSSEASSGHSFFSRTSTSGAPGLNPLTIQKLLKQLIKLKSLGRGKEEIFVEDVEVEGVKRLVGILERSWSGGEWEGDWWSRDCGGKKVGGGVGAKKKGKGRAGTASPKKEKVVRRSSRSRSRSRSRSGSGSRTGEGEGYGERSEEEKDEEREEEESPWTGDLLSAFANKLVDLTNALLSIKISLLLLSSPTIPTSITTTDFWQALFRLLRSILDNLLLPLEDPSITTPTHLETLLTTALTSKPLKETTSTLISTLSSLSTFITQKLTTQSWSEDLLIKPFCLAISATTSKKQSGIGEEGLGLVRGLLGKWEGQKAWVLEEVLGGSGVGEMKGRGKGGFRLRTGGSIHGFSAVVLTVVQSLGEGLGRDVRARVREGGEGEKSHKAKEGQQEEEESEEKEEEERGEKDGLSIANREFVNPALDGARNAASKIITFLLQKSCKSGKVSSGSTEAEYRIVLDNFIGDLLTTLHLPEWPAAEVLLTVCCRTMMATLVDSKSTHEINALKNVSLDHLGLIGARIRGELNKSLKVKEGLKTLPEILANSDVEGLEELFDAEKVVLRHLFRSDSGSSSEGAARFTQALFGRDLLQASHAAKAIVNKFSAAELKNKEGLRGTVLADKLESMASEIWNVSDEEEDVFGPNAGDEQPRVDALLLQLTRSQPLAALYDPLLKQILDASESTAVSFRTKSLRGISLIVAQDPELFLQEDVRKTIQNRILDSSPAVRDAALELVGKYVVTRPDLAVEYLPIIGERINDTGLSVRRRVVKLLKVLFNVVDQDKLRIDICRKLVGRAVDEDDGIKDLAIDAIEELWFSKTLPASKAQAAVTEDSQTSDAGAKSGISHLAWIIMAVASSKGQPAPVDVVFRHIIQKYLAKDAKPPFGRLREVMESLIDGLVEDDEALNVMDCIKTVYIINCAVPSLLTTAKATLLLPFLKSSATPVEQTISDYLLKIFRSTVSALPKGPQKFSRDLQSALLPMLNRPAPSSTAQTLQEIVSCFCAVIRGQTHDFPKLISIFKACAGRLAAETRKLLDEATSDKINVRAIPMLAYLTSLLAEFGDFDKIRAEFPAETKVDIDSVVASSVSEHVFSILLKLHSARKADAGSQAAALTSLGFIYRAYPTLLLKAQSTTILDAVFASPNIGTRLQLLRILQDFLASQDRSEAAATSSKVKTEKENRVKIDELVGNVEGFADSGVASAISQRYIEQIIDSSLSTNPQIQRVGVDILTAVARSGFSHPLTMAPPLIALCGSADSTLSSKAYGTLSVLHQKHGSLLATRYLHSVKTVHRYADAVAGTAATRGYSGDPPLSYLMRWYGLLKDKRQYQLEFLKSLSRLFEVDLGVTCSERDVSFGRFVAEALSTLDFKRNEEPMLVLHHLNNALAVSGLQVLHSLQEGTEGGGGLMAEINDSGSPLKRGGSFSPMKGGSASPSKVDLASSLSTPAPTPGPEDEVQPPSLSLARQSIVAGLALLLRDHLKALYTISDAKLAAFKPGKKSAFGDKATIRKSGAIVALGSDDYPRLPLVLQAMDTPALLEEQRDTYIKLIQDDGTIGALEELEVDDEA